MNVLKNHAGRRAMKGRKLSRFHLAGTAVLAGAMAVTALAGTSGATAKAHAVASLKSHAKTVKPDYAFFRGKTIHWITPGAPGSTQDVYFRAISPYLSQQLGATFVQEIIPGNQIIAADELANSTPDGLTIGTQGVGAALYNELTNVTPESFSLQKVTYFGSVPNTTYILVSCAGSGIDSLAQLMSSKAQITYLDFPSASDVIWHVFLEAYGVNLKYLTGYTQPTLQQGCIRGDGQIAGTAATILNVSTALPPGETLLAITSKYGPGTPARWQNTDPTSTTIPAWEKKHPIKDVAARRALNIVLGTLKYGPNTTTWGPAGIPPARAAALEAVIEKGIQTPTVEAAFLSQNIPPGYRSPAQILTAIKEEVSHFPSIRRFALSTGL